MDFINKYVRRNEPQNTSFMDEINNNFSIGFTKRIILFVVFLLLGIFFCFISTWVILMPRSFAKFYTLGTIFIIASTFFLVGPAKQIKSMFHPSRVVAAAIYFGSMGVTLYSALSLQNTLLTLIMIFVQFGAALWYGASYIPFLQECLRGTARTVLPI